MILMYQQVRPVQQKKQFQWVSKNKIELPADPEFELQNAIIIDLDSGNRLKDHLLKQTRKLKNLVGWAGSFSILNYQKTIPPAVPNISELQG